MKAAPALAGMGERGSGKMNPAALPRRLEDAGDGGLDAAVGVGDDQLDPGQAAALELAQELDPEGLGLRRADVHAQHLAPAVGVDGHRDGDGDRDDAPVLADLHVGGVEPQIRPVAFDRAAQERLHAVVDVFAQPADLALGDAGHPHGLDQIVDRARRDALDVGLLDHCGERLLRQPARLQETGKLGALAQLRDAQFNGAGACFPIALAVAVALDQPLG